MEIRTVRQRGAETGETGEAAEVLRALGFPASVRQNEGLAVARVSRRRARAARLVRLVRLTWKVRRARLLRGVRGSRLLTEERGAVTAEYALVIMAAVAFAGLLIVIMRSEEVRSMLLSLVQNALGSAG